MKFMTVREFRGNTGQIRSDLEQENEIVLTANGQPFALVSRLRPEQFDRDVLAIRRARARLALERVHDSAERAGSSKLTATEIADAIRSVRTRKAAA
jgi:hypothetical protein